MSDAAAETETPRRLAGADLDLVAPTSLVECWDVAILAETEGARERAFAAALGLCWPRFRRRHPYGGNALVYSTRVLETLLATPGDDGQPPKIGEILRAGVAAFGLISERLVPVEGAERF